MDQSPFARGGFERLRRATERGRFDDCNDWSGPRRGRVKSRQSDLQITDAHWRARADDGHGGAGVESSDHGTVFGFVVKVGFSLSIQSEPRGCRLLHTFGPGG